MGNESRLIHEVYFISPEYKDKCGKVKSEETSTSTRVTAQRIPDKKDDFWEWLKENTHYAEYHGYKSGIMMRKLMGENGVLCEISTLEYCVESKSTFMIPGSYGEYNMLVKIVASPSSKDIPPELMSAINERGYVEKSGEEQIKNYNNGVTPISDFFE